MPALLRSIEAGERCDLTEGPPRPETFYYRVGFADYIDSHEFVALYSGRSMAELRNEKAAAEAASAAESGPYFGGAYEQLLAEQTDERLLLPVVP
jgi:hypothetical protein